MRIKKLITGLLAAVLSLGLATGTAFAAGSKEVSNGTGGVTVVSNGYVVSAVADSASFAKIQSETPAVAAAITAINDAITSAINAASDAVTATQTLLTELQNLINDSSLPDSVKTSAQEVLDTLQSEDKQVVTPFFDLSAESENVTKTADGKYQVTLDVPSLTESTKGIVVLHYSPTRQVWELITPSATDLANHTITVEFEDLSPVMILADENTADGITDLTSGKTSTASASSSSSSTQSPKTGVESHWMGFAAAAVVLAAAGAGVFVFRRRSNNA